MDLVIARQELMGNVPGVQALAGAFEFNAISLIGVGKEFERWCPGLNFPAGTLGKFNEVLFHQPVGGVENLHALRLELLRVINYHVVNAARVPARPERFNKVFVRALLDELLPVLANGAGFAICFHEAYETLALNATDVPVFKHFEHIRETALLRGRVKRPGEVWDYVQFVHALIALPKLNVFEIATEKTQATSFTCLF
jgi:hypothetical protein